MKEKFVERVQSYFNNNKQIDHYRIEQLQGPTSVEEILLNRIIPNSKAKILDVGCGAGRVSIELAQRGFYVEAADISVKLLELGSKRAKEEQIDLKFILLNNTEKLLSEFQECEQYDYIVLFKVYCYIPTKKQRNYFMNKIYELTKPNGKILMTQNVVPEEYYSDYMDEHYELLSNSYKEIEPGDTFPEGTGFVHWFTEQGLEDELKKTPFKVEFYQNDSGYDGNGYLQMVVLEKVVGE